MVAALALLAGPGLTACSSPAPAPPRQPVGVETSVSTRDYPVLGTTTAAIFTAIDADGPVETSGQRAVGVTSTEEYNRLVADANGLIDALNWARW